MKKKRSNLDCLKIIFSSIILCILFAFVCKAEDIVEDTEKEDHSLFNRVDFSEKRTDKEKEFQTECAKIKAKYMNRLWDAKNLYHLANKKEDISELIILLFKARDLIIPIYKNRQYLDLRNDAKNLLLKIQKKMRNVPPPKEFTLDGMNIVMKLVENVNEKDEVSFYISSEPITAKSFAYYLNRLKEDEDYDKKRLSKFLFKDKSDKWIAIDNSPICNIAYDEAQAFVQWFNKNVPGIYSLPSVTELQKMNIQKNEKMLSWTKEIQIPLLKKDLFNRFGIKMIRIWDPKRKNGNYITEVPSAYYSNLGMWLVAPVKTGKKVRLLKLGVTK
ncbi:MAG: SUMF1/EgtB/PvdO family nonheme iron enzyme [Verrucomicrobiota bacterium]|nr:SUMF1/EgtB/PvdO family nonheme iron enzyme [Verrucomicrobiota bacterium]